MLKISVTKEEKGEVGLHLQWGLGLWLGLWLGCTLCLGVGGLWVRARGPMTAQAS